MTGPESDKHAGYWQITAVDQQVLDVGVVEGPSSAINQIDDLVAS